MSPDKPRELSDEEINEAGPEASKRASSPLYAAQDDSLTNDDEEDRAERTSSADEEE
jgi:hypothetical protein